MVSHILHSGHSYVFRKGASFFGPLPFAWRGKRYNLLLFLPFYIASSLLNLSWAQAPAIQWQNALGGTADDVPQCIYPTQDGGFVIGGAAGSTDGDIVGNHGGGDLWVAKVNSTGTLQWKKALGGAGQEKGALVQPTLDGGYIVGGTTASSNGDVVGNKGRGDIWVVKLSSSGAIQWQKCLGGRASDEIVALQEVTVKSATGALLSDGFIVGGNTLSNNGDVSGYHGGKDVWVVKLSTAGVLQWQRALGSAGEETLNELGPTPDGGYIIGSRTSTNGGDVSGVHGSVDLWIVKLDGAGNITWKRTLGGSGLENLAAVKPTKDGGYIVGTSTNSNDGDINRVPSTVQGIWVVKLNATGGISWQKNYHENGESEFRGIRQTKEDGYIVSGMGHDNSTTTSGGILVSKLNADGTEAWRKEHGIGSEGVYHNNEPYVMQQTADAGYVLAGANIKTISSDKGHWMLKLDANGNKKWDRVYGGSGEDWYCAGFGAAITLGGNLYFSSLLPYMNLQSSDGGYYFAVATKSRDGDVTGLHYSARMGVRADMWVVKVNPDGLSASGSLAAATEDGANIYREASAYPNPFSAQTTIRFTAKETGTASVDLYTIHGARIRTIYNGGVTTGQEYRVQLIDTELPKGTYVYRIKTNGSCMSGRLVKH